MTPWEKLQWLQANTHLVHVSVNEHRAYYDTVEQTLETRDGGLFDADEADVRAECIRRGELVTVQVYPDTPIGFFLVGHWELDKAIDAAYEAVQKDRRATQRHTEEP